MGNRKHHDEDFIRNLVRDYYNGRTQVSLSEEYGVSQATISRWIKQYALIKTKKGIVLSNNQVDRIRELEKRINQLEVENIILKKASAIFMQHSNND